MGTVIVIANDPLAVFDADQNPVTGNGAHSGTDAGRVPLHLDTLRSRLLTPSQLDQLPPPEPLIEGICFRDTLIATYGKPGVGKSFVAIDWALSIATGSWWFDRPVTSGFVVYIAAEGAAGLSQRKRAWEQSRNVIVADGQIVWLPMPVNLLDTERSEALVQLIAELEPVLVVVDTVSRSMPGGDENAPKDMTRLVENADRVRAASGATVNLVHHSPKDGGSLRGHSSLEGAVDTAIEVKADGGSIIISCAKQKDAAKFDNLRFDLAKTGESCALTLPRGGESNSLTEKTLLEAMWESCGSDGLSSGQLITVSGIPDSTYYRTLKALVDRGLARNVGTEKRPRYLPVGSPPV
jgi:hypothetical protein